MPDFTIEPAGGENYEGRQYGYWILKDGRRYLHVVTGGTGPCWNIEDAEFANEHAVTPLHACELDELIGALKALRDSPANATHIKRWA